MRKKILSIMIFSIVMLSACGEDLVQSANKEESVSSQTTLDTQNISTGYVVTNGQSYVELYSNMEASNVISRMYDNEPVTVYSIQGDWANISYGGMVGYIKLQNLSFVESTVVENTTVQTSEETSKKETESSAKEEKKSSENVQLNQNIEQNVNIVFLCDSDGFEYAQPTSYTSYVSSNENAWCSAESIYIYSQPDTSSHKREADMLYYGDVLTILGSVDGWYYIATDSGNGYDLHGYVKQKYITIGETPVAPEPVGATHGCVNVESANVRSSPNKETNDNVLFTIYKGEEFDVLDYDGYWYKIDYNGTICYISHKMVDVW